MVNTIPATTASTERAQEAFLIELNVELFNGKKKISGQVLISATESLTS